MLSKGKTDYEVNVNFLNISEGLAHFAKLAEAPINTVSNWIKSNANDEDICIII